MKNTIAIVSIEPLNSGKGLLTATPLPKMRSVPCKMRPVATTAPPAMHASTMVRSLHL